MEPFTPLLKFDDMEDLFSFRSEHTVENDEAYSNLEKLTSMAHPTFKDEFDTKWDSFYLPLKRRRKLITLPLYVGLYQSSYYLQLDKIGNLTVKKGDKADNAYLGLFDEVKRFIPLVKDTNNSIIGETYPYDTRRGKIKGRHVLKKLMPEKKRRAVDAGYSGRNKTPLKQISLDDYLSTAALCYKAAFGDRVDDKTPLELYKCWADGRHGGMLDIKDAKSRKKYMKWLNSNKWSGSHPFEIVRGMVDLGVGLFPPSGSSQQYRISVSTLGYYKEFIAMVDGLVKAGTPFEAPRLGHVLDYMTGESFIDVNAGGFDTFYYENTKEFRKKYFPHIEWEPIAVVRWR